MQYSFKKIKLNEFVGGMLEVQAFELILENRDKIMILNCYNPSEDVTVRELRHYFGQLSEKFIVIGDFNGHTRVLDSKCTRSNYTGRLLERVKAEDEICLINPQDMYTYVSFSNLKKSCLDICMTSLNIAPLSTVRVMRDVGSDHLPIEVPKCGL